MCVMSVWFLSRPLSWPKAKAEWMNPAQDGMRRWESKRSTDAGHIIEIPDSNKYLHTRKFTSSEERLILEVFERYCSGTFGGCGTHAYFTVLCESTLQTIVAAVSAVQSGV